VPFRAHATGNFASLSTYGIYSKGCAVERRLLCQVEGNATCERLDDDLVHCHPDPKQGCPHSARSLSAAGHLLNTEDLGASCYEICSDGMRMVRCTDGWKVLGACDTTATPRRNVTRRARPMLFGQPVRQPKSKEPDFSHIKAAGRALKDVSTLARIRSMYFTETGDWEGAWAHSRATDKIPIFRKFESMMRSLSPVNHARPVVPEPKRRVLETLISNCNDPTLVSCCSGACVQPGTPCPAINPLSFTQNWCQAINDATHDVNTFDMGAYLAGIVNCVQNYDNNPDTNPFGPDAASSQVVSYCWPMRGPQSWGFGGVSLNFKGWLLSLCGGELAAGQQCSCPMYSCVPARGRSDARPGTTPLTTRGCGSRSCPYPTRRASTTSWSSCSS
jgi:hypothetical protein